MSHQVEVFERWLADLLAAGEQGTRLPSQRSLAQRFGLSSTTIGRLLRPPLSDGRIYGGPGIGMRIGPPPTPTAGPRLARERPLVDRLLQAIAQGAWRQGEVLPAQRELCRRFRVGWPTLVRALGDLERRCVVHRQGRQWIVGRDRSALAIAHGRVLLFADETQLDNRQVESLLGPMEDLLHRLDLRLDILPHERFAAYCEPALLNSERIRGLVSLRVVEIRPAAVIDQWRSFVAQHPSHPARLLLIGKRLPDGRPPPAQADLLCFDSLHTLAARAAVDLAASRPLREVVILHDGQRPRQLKNSLRVVAELGQRMPEAQWRILVVDPALPGRNGAFLDAVLDLDDVDHASYLRLLDEHGQLGMDGLRQAITTCAHTQAWHFQADDLVLLSSPDLVAKLVHAGHDPVSARHGPRWLCLRDAPICRRFGIATCDADWPGTAHAAVHALLDDLPVERGAHGYLRPQIRLLARASLQDDPPLGSDSTCLASLAHRSPSG